VPAALRRVRTLVNVRHIFPFRPPCGKAPLRGRYAVRPRESDPNFPLDLLHPPRRTCVLHCSIPSRVMFQSSPTGR
jgi:hypothetical protein